MPKLYDDNRPFVRHLGCKIYWQMKSLWLEPFSAEDLVWLPMPHAFCDWPKWAQRQFLGTTKD